MSSLISYFKSQKYLLLLILMLCSAPSYSLFPLENDTIKHRVFVTANTADIEEDSIIYTELKNLFSANPEPFTFIISGDLISEDITQENASFQIAKIRKLLETSSGSENGRVVIIPGERDWADSGEEGWKSVKELEKRVKDLGYSHVTWAHKKGCPGPRVIKLNPNLLLVTINTQWWNHPYDKPKPVDANCDVITDIDFQEAFEDVLDENKDKNILIAGHYPIISLGEYGGYMPVTRYIFPLPVVGGFIAAYHRNVGSTDDIVNENFDDIRRMLGQTIAYRKTLIYLSGHELNLQILNRGENYAINSGSIGVARHAGRNRSALISEKMRGVIEIVYYESGRIDSIVHEYTEAEEFTLHSRFNLYQEACGKVEGATPVNTAIVPCEEKPVVTEKMAGTYDTPAIVAAGPEYAAGRFKRFWFGDHYRDTWTQEVEVPYLDLDNTFGGLTPYRRGGGRQSKSLRLKAPDGRRYVFRSVNKDASVRLPYELRDTVAGEVMRDQTTIAQPYGALAADVMQTELGFLHPHPQLYVMPDDEKLGPFREEFGNMLGMLEEFPREPDKGEAAYADSDQVLKSYKLFSKLYADHDNRINSQHFARARMFDILIGAGDRHEDNWKWAGYDQTKGKEYEPIPRDRDNIFTLFDGFLPFMVDREWALPMFEEFDYKIKGLRSLTWQARHLDRFLASELSRDDWVEAAKFVQERVTDEVIETAVRNMPLETYEISGKEIEAKLKERIKDLDTYAEEYYEMLAREVDVVGSNDDEYFEVLRNEGGSVAVVVYNIADKGSKERGNKLLYRRTFYPNETKEVRLFGLGGEDVFFVEGESKKSIKVRIVGGHGDDTYEDKSRVKASAKKTLIYEKDGGENIDLGKEAKLVSSVNESAYDYDRTAFKYNTYLPLLWVLYNSSNKFVFAGALRFTTQRYGKEDYSTKHTIGAGLATGGSKVVGYDGTFHHVLGKWDVTLRGGAAYPAYVVEFYGLGNDTVKDGNSKKPTPTPTPANDSPGFAAVFVIAGVLLVAYLIGRKRE